MIGNTLMYDSHQVRCLAIHLESKLSLSIGFGAPGLFHALPEFEQDDFITRCRHVDCRIGNGSGESLRVPETRGQQKSKRQGKKFQLRCSSKRSRLAISARIPAASSSRERSIVLKSASGSLPARKSKFKSRKFS